MSIINIFLLALILLLVIILIVIAIVGKRQEIKERKAIFKELVSCDCLINLVFMPVNIYKLFILLRFLLIDFYLNL